MKKIIIILLILIFPLMVKAELTKEQQEDIAAFSRNFIIKGNGSEHKSGNFGILAYNQGSRNEGFVGQLSYMNKDYKRKNTINAKKWTFDCSSFAAYVYYHCFGVKTTYLSNNSPYVVSKFVEDANRGHNFYFVMTNQNTDTLNYSQLQKGDLIVFVGSHIMVYIGDGKIAHFSSTAIAMGTNIGSEVIDLKTRFPNHKTSVIRIKNGIVPTSAKANMTIKWPDTGKTEDLSDKDDLPKVNVSYNDVVGNEVIVKISATDDKGIIGYQITTSTPSNYTNVDKQKSFETTYKVTNNGTYYVYVKDTKNQVTKKEFVITKLDNSKPEITNINYRYNHDKNNFYIEIKASDNGNLLYSLDDSAYQDNNTFDNVSIGNHLIKVKDDANNITEYTLTLSNDLIPTININYDSNYTKLLKVNIIGVDQEGIDGYNVTKTNEEPKTFLTYTNGQTYTINTNGTYYFWIRNKKGIVVNKSVTINNIDNIGPVINNVTIKNTFNGYDVNIDATDTGCGIGYYSLDGNNYQDVNHYDKVDTIYANIFVKDKCDNLTIYKVDFDSIEDDNIGTIIMIAAIVFVGVIILVNIFTMEKKKR